MNYFCYKIPSSRCWEFKSIWSVV